MKRYTLDTLPLHALHSHSADLLLVWYGLSVTGEELSSARARRPLHRYYVIVEAGPARVRVAEIVESIAEARGKVATHAPFARVATLRHNASEHEGWPGKELDIGVGDTLSPEMFDWTR